MHATSAVAFAIIALNAASTLAIPMAPLGGGLEASSGVYRRSGKSLLAPAASPSASPSPDDATAKSTKPTRTTRKAGTRTVTVRVIPLCNKSGSGASKGKSGAPAPARIAPRAAGAASPTSGTQDSAAAAAPAPTPKALPQNLRAGLRNAAVGEVFATSTIVGEDHTTTVKRYRKGANTNCPPEPTASASAGSSTLTKRDGKGYSGDGAARNPADSTRASGSKPVVDDATKAGNRQHHRPAANTDKPPARERQDRLGSRAADILERYFNELDELD